MRIVLLLVASLVVAPAVAAPPPPNFVFSPNGTWGEAGGLSSTMTLRVRGDGRFVAAEIAHTYDARLFDAFVAAAPGAACIVSDNPKTRVGTIRTVVATPDLSPVPTTWTDLCHVHFRTARTTPPGDYPITVWPGALLCLDALSEVVPCTELTQGRLLHVVP